MIRRRTALRVVAAGAALAAAGAVTVGLGKSAGAVDALQHGYWWAGQAGSVPAPPTVPAGGLWVSSNATGTQAVSAVRFSLGEGESAPILTLAVHSSTPVATGAVIACPTSATWAPGDAQAFGAKPAADCSSGSVAGVMSDDGKRMAFNLSLFPAASTYSVVLSPTPASLPVAVPKPPVAVPTPDSGPTVDVTFEQPTLSAITVLTGVVDTTPTTSETVDQTATAGSATPDLSTATVTTPRPRAVTATTRPARARRGATATVPIRPISSADDRGDRVLAAIAFVALAGWAWRLSFSGGTPAPARASIYGGPPAAPAVVTETVGRRAGGAPTLR